MQVHFPLKKEGVGSKIIGILLLAAMFCSGILAVWLLCLLNGMNFGFYTWPLVVCVDVFVFSTVGFFCTEGNAEVIYGACSILSALCALIQMALIF